MSALRLINETTASSVASISVTDVFTSDFDIYQFEINNLDFSANANAQVRFINSSGSVISSANYDYANLSLKSYGAFADTLRATNATGLEYTAFSSSGSADSMGWNFYCFNPYSSSSYTFYLGQSSAWLSGAGGGNYGTKSIGVLKLTNSMTGINLYTSTGTFDNITVRTYGLRVDNG